MRFRKIILSSTKIDKHICKQVKFLLEEDDVTATCVWNIDVQ